MSFLPAQNRLDGFAITPDGDYAAIDFHGEIFIVPTDPEIGEKRQVTTTHGASAAQAFSPNGRWMAYRSDESKEEEIWLFDRETGNKRKLTTHESFKTIDAWSPDSTRLVWSGGNRLFLTTAETGATHGARLQPGRRLQRQRAGLADGKWLVFTKRDADQNADVVPVEIDTKRELNVTRIRGATRRARSRPTARA